MVGSTSGEVLEVPGRKVPEEAVGSKLVVTVAVECRGVQ